MAIDLRELGRLDEAEGVLRGVLERHPKNFDALMGLGHIMRRRGDRTTALALFEAAAEAHPQHVLARTEIAIDLRELGRLSEAEAMLLGVLKTQPKNLDALLGLGHVMRRRGDRTASLALFEAAVAAGPSHIGAALEVIQGLRDLGRLDEATSRLEQLIAVHPENRTALVALGSLKLERFELDEAERLFRCAVSMAPRDTEIRLWLGRLARRRGEHEDALARFEEARSADPANVDAVLEIAVELRELGRYDDAQRAIETVLQSRPSHHRARMELGYLYRKAGERGKALEVFRAAHDEWPSLAQIIVEMADEERALGRPAEAERLLRQALAIDGNNLGALDRLAGHYFVAEDFEQSLAFGLRGIEAHPNRLIPYLHASRAAVELGRKDEALQFLGQARDAIGPHPEIRAARVSIHLKEQDWDQARVLLSESEAELRQYACLWTQCAALRLALGDYAGAAEALPSTPPQDVQAASRVHIFRGLISELHWQLEDAATHYRKGIALDANEGWGHTELARTLVKLLDLEASRAHQRRKMDLDVSASLLRGQSLNISQSMLGQLTDEFALDQTLLDELRRIRCLPLEQQVQPLKELVLRYPDHTPSAIMLLIAMRQANRLLTTLEDSATGTFDHIPKRIIQYWDAAKPPQEVLELMQQWHDNHPDFEYLRFDDRSAQKFLSDHAFRDALQAYRHARQPAQRADIFRLAYLSTYGGFYADVDDRCVAHLGSFVPSSSKFAALQESFGTLGNNFLAAMPEHPVIRLALECGTDAINRGDVDVLWLSTGPGLLTRAFAHVFASGDYTSAESFAATIFDQGYLTRYIGLHYPLRYKTTERHWGRSSFRRTKR
jgi:tetratricopeptide (TPR) repeat protein